MNAWCCSGPWWHRTPSSLPSNNGLDRTNAGPARKTGIAWRKRWSTARSRSRSPLSPTFARLRCSYEVGCITGCVRRVFGPARSAFGRAWRAYQRYLLVPRAVPSRLVLLNCPAPTIVSGDWRVRDEDALPTNAVASLVTDSIQAAQVCRSVDAADCSRSAGRCAGGASCRAPGAVNRLSWGCLAAVAQGWSAARAADRIPSGGRCADEAPCARDHAGWHSEVCIARMWARGLG